MATWGSIAVAIDPQVLPQTFRLGNSMSTSRDTWLNRLTTVTMLVVALGLLGLRVYEHLDNKRGSSGAVVGQVDDWKSYRRGGQWIGDSTARVTIIEFSDFQCPVCRSASQVLDSILRNTESVSLLYRHYPLSMHPHAKRAAIASECAADQGRFEEFYSALWEGADSIGVRTWASFAFQAGVGDTSRFVSCLDDAAIERRVMADSMDANRLNVGGTPTFLVNGVRINGLPNDRSVFLSAISRQR